jgi:hypothetical protein
LNNFFIYLKTINKLGFINVISVLLYRIITHSFLVKLIFPKKYIKQLGEVFLTINPINKTSQKNYSNILDNADSILNGNVLYYSFHLINVGQTPNWFLNPFNGESYKNHNEHWAKLGDFNPHIGDIKNIWELSRFNWIGTLACAYKITHDDAYLNKINDWIKDWLEKNPPNTGPNWKCGQEASIRAINILLANEMIVSDEVSSDLVNLLITHIERITPTTFYAKAQDNNHGLSEGIALYLLGHFLWKETNEQKYKNLHNKGLKLIENRIQKLIMDDGTFSQYSIVYHRMVLDLLSVLEIFKQKWNLGSFSDAFYVKSKLAIDWYSEMIDPQTGNAPNMGANDGTYLFNFDQKEYRDFRPSLVLASSLFNASINRTIEADHCLLNIFSLSPNFVIKKKKPMSKVFFDGGYLKLVRKNGMALLRAPKYLFRPSHSDALHIDIWQDGINWIRDAGSFSYAINSHELDTFSGTRGHSTIQFDNRNQMLRLSRFLFGDWLTPSNIEFSKSDNRMSVAYTSKKNNCHSRSVNKIENGWEIQDEISGKFIIAVLRWILNPSDWTIKGNVISNGQITLNISSNHYVSLKLKKGFESLYYMSKVPVPILEIECSTECFINTNISFAA